MKLKKLLAAVLALTILTALLPTAALAAEDGDEGGGATTSSGVELSKTAVLENDGTYTITLEAYATGEVKTTTTTETAGVPCDIVLVIDQSTSMKEDMGNTTRLQALKNAATAFIEQVQRDALDNRVDHKIAVVGFASSSDSNYTNTELLSTDSEVNYSNATSTDYQNALVSANVNGSVNSNLTTAINRVTAEGSTYADLGLEMAQNVLTNRTETTYPAPDGTTANRKTIVVFFTDGYPGRHTGARFFDGTPRSGISSKDFITVTTANGAIQAANSLKAAGTTVYSIGVLDGADPAAGYNFKVYTSSNATSDNLYDIGVERNRANDLKVGYLSAVQAVNAYLHFVSSDYAAVEDTPTMETYDRSKVVNNGYYLAASSADELSKVFETISSSINTSTSFSSCTLNEDSVLKDVISGRFALPEGYDADSSVTVRTAEYQGNGSFGTPILLSDAQVSVDGSTINVSGFDYSSNYVVDASENGQVETGGKKLIVTIQGVLPTENAFTGKAVYTNTSASGIYADANATDAAAVFDRPQTILTSKTYVLDYAKEAQLTGLDQTPNAITGALRAVSSSDTSVDDNTYGNAELRGGTVTYTPKTTNWDGYDSFYVFGTTTDETIRAVDANKDGKLWSKVSVLPANSVYYEDDFVTNERTGAVGIVYGGEWTTDRTSSGNTETANDPIHGGWVEDDTGLSDDTGYSDGSAHQAVASSENTATASFTFTGTGVDIYSRTDMNTGTILVVLTGGPEGSTVSKALSVDNKAVSGDYYQIPTAAFSGLDYGTYTVTLYVTTAAGVRSTYYLDGIRVYNPIQALEETDATVQEAYGEELGAVFTEVRELLRSDGTAFIDEGEDGQPAAGDYTESDTGKIAPEHEIYLGPGQSVVINASGGENYYIGLKSPTGNEVTAEISVGEANKSTISVSHTTDLYYKVTPNSDGTITIQNASGEDGSILSITKLRVTGSDASEPAALSDEQAIQAYAAFQSYALVAYSAAPVAEEELPEESAAPEEPEEAEPDVTESEEPAGEEPGEVVIENPKEFGKHDDKNNNNKQPAPKHTDREWAENLFRNFKGLFGR